MRKSLFILAFVSIGFFSCKKSFLDSNVSNTPKTGSLASFMTYNDALYILDGTTLKSYSIKDRVNPSLIQALEMGSTLETLFILDDVMLIGSTDAVFVMSIDSSGRATKTGVAEHIRTCDPVVSDGKYAYSTTRANSQCGGTISAMTIYDISNIYYPMIVSQLQMTQPLGLAINGNTLYVCDLNNGLVVIDVTDRQNPQRIINYPNVQARDIILLDSETMLVMVPNGIWFYNIHEPLSPKLKYKYE